MTKVKPTVAGLKRLFALLNGGTSPYREGDGVVLDYSALYEIRAVCQDSRIL